MTMMHREPRLIALRLASGILFLTAVLKLYGVCFSLSLPSASDPVLSFLTRKQVLVFAALGEIAVALYLFRQPHFKSL